MGSGRHIFHCIYIEFPVLFFFISDIFSFNEWKKHAVGDLSLSKH